MLQSVLKNKVNILLPLLLFLIFCTDNTCPSIFLPLLPKLVAIFHVTRAELKQAVSMVLAGVFLSELTIGLYFSYLDSRKVFMLLFTALIAGGICSANATNIDIFWLGEFLQGFGIGAAYPLIQVLINFYMKEKATVLLSYIPSICVFMFFLSPIIGALFYFHWTWVFYFIVIISFFMLILASLLPHAPRQKMELLGPLKSLGMLCCNSQYILGVLFNSFSSLGFYVFLAWAPFIFIQDLHVSYHGFSYLLFFPTLAGFFGYVVAGLFGNKHDAAFLLGISLALLSGALLVSLFFLKIVYPATIIALGSLYCFAFSLIMTHNSLFILSIVKQQLSAVAMCFSSVCLNFLSVFCMMFLAKIALDDGLILGSVFIIIALINFVLFFLRVMLRKR